jgi:peptidoglycan hydrolase CwlO-like protein
VAEEPDLRFLGEQIKRLQGDVRLLKSDMAQVRADSVKVESDVAAVKADIARVETKLEVFREFADDRFDRTDLLIQSNFRTLSERIDGQSGQIESLSEQMKTLSEQMKTLSEQVDGRFTTILTEIRALRRT